MSSLFWSNTIWYILLAVTSIITLVFVLKKSENRRFTVAFTLASLGFVYMVEAILVIVLNAYCYYPKIVINDLFQDSVLGNIFSQVSIASTAALSIVYDLSFGWTVLFAAIYYLIDILFIKLGIYEHFWYLSVYTFIGFIPLFALIKWYYKIFVNSAKYIFHHLALYSGVFAITGNTIILPMKLLKIQIFNINFFGQLSKDHTTFSIIYGFVLINILIFVYRARLHWIWKSTALFVLFIIQFILYQAGVILFRDGWFIIGTALDIFGIYLWIAVLDRFLSQKPSVYGS